QPTDEVPAHRASALGEGLGLLHQALSRVLTKVAHAPVVGLEHLGDGLVLAHRDEPHALGISSGRARRVLDAPPNVGQSLGDTHASRSTAASTSASGKPTTLVYEPSMRSTSAPPSPWMP